MNVDTGLLLILQEYTEKGFPTFMRTNPYFENTGFFNSNVNFMFTKEEKEEYELCKNDIFYFMKYVKINGKSFELFDFQKELLKNLIDNQKNLIKSARQMGMSHVMGIYFSWKCLFSEESQFTILVDKKLQGHDLISKIQDILLNVPFFLRPSVTSNTCSGIKFSSGKNIDASIFFSKRFVNVGEIFIQDSHKIKNEDFVDLMKILHKYYEYSEKPLKITIDTKTDLSYIKKDDFKETFLPWNLYPSRDNDWKNREIMMLGKESFYFEYELIPISHEDKLKNQIEDFCKSIGRQDKIDELLNLLK